MWEYLYMVTDMTVESYWYDSWQLLTLQQTVIDMTVVGYWYDNYWQDRWQLLTGQLLSGSG